MPRSDSSSDWLLAARHAAERLPPSLHRPRREADGCSSATGCWVALGALVSAGLLVAAGSCVRVPRGVHPVRDFDVRRYAGTWYEIARIDHRFEQGLTHTSAHYAVQPGGRVQVINRGYDTRKATWKESEGRACFLGDHEVAALKVSFFGPFYGGYNVVGLDEDYETALVIGSTLDYCWLLSRHRRMDDAVFDAWMERAAALGVDRSKLLRVPQD